MKVTFLVRAIDGEFTLMRTVGAISAPYSPIEDMRSRTNLFRNQDEAAFYRAVATAIANEPKNMQLAYRDAEPIISLSRSHSTADGEFKFKVDAHPSGTRTLKCYTPGSLMADDQKEPNLIGPLIANGNAALFYRATAQALADAKERGLSFTFEDCSE